MSEQLGSAISEPALLFLDDGQILGKERKREVKVWIDIHLKGGSSLDPGISAGPRMLRGSFESP